MKSNLKALGSNQGFEGLIESEAMYERLKNGEIDWKDHVKTKMKYVKIPYELLMKLMELDKNMTKCTLPGGVEIRPDGENILDPCSYEVKEIHRNVTVTISECSRCGSVDISWERQENTESEIMEE